MPQGVLDGYDDLRRGAQRIADLPLGDPDVLLLKSASGISQRRAFVAALLATDIGDRPHLLRVETRTGRGAANRRARPSRSSLSSGRSPSNRPN
ncbi:hypothetical protein [Ochrobactrum quorumnocens]|uniref:hypothetical protein n=1 Tax=Ochrobactrum quorumnocens TaxID=271865 RepID=UPI0012FD7928|nr:hypothetical protein [[Ochrobactrum] quorumnocens]